MKKAIHLLQKFQEFQEIFPVGNLHDFGEWLVESEAEIHEVEIKVPELRESPLDVKLAYFLGGLSSYLESWVKISFNGLPIRSLGDFTVLVTVQSLANPSKKDISDAVVMEHSTCIEVLKRFAKDGLIQEERDEQDKRVVRVTLSPKGMKVVGEIAVKLNSLSKLLSANLSEEEKQSMLLPLSKMMKFHSNIYLNMDKETIKEEFDL